jgi:hypothetical protein
MRSQTPSAHLLLELPNSRDKSSAVISATEPVAAPGGRFFYFWRIPSIQGPPVQGPLVQGWIFMASEKQRSAARKNIKKPAAAKTKRTIAHLPKAVRTALGKQAAKVRKRQHA